MSFRVKPRVRIAPISLADSLHLHWLQTMMAEVKTSEVVEDQKRQRERKKKNAQGFECMSRSCRARKMLRRAQSCFRFSLHEGTGWRRKSRQKKNNQHTTIALSNSVRTSKDCFLSSACRLQFYMGVESQQEVTAGYRACPARANELSNQIVSVERLRREAFPCVLSPSVRFRHFWKRTH